LAPDELSKEKAAELLSAAAHGPESLGDHPTSHKPIYLKAGRFGPYVQEGVAEGEEKPKMASLLPGMAPADVTLDIAIKLLSLPRTVGIDPASGGDIQAMNGRFGPYIKCGSESRSIPAGYSLLDLSLSEALEILAQPKTGGRQRAAPAAPLRELGAHPETKKPLVIKSGRYGPYVTDGELNASLPRGADPVAFSVEEAVALLAERAAKIEQDGGVKRKAPAKRGASASGAAKGAPKKKAATKPADEGADKGTTEKKATKAAKPTRVTASGSTAKKRASAGGGSSSATSKKGKRGAK
jgi:DNA topoisomerase-1